MDDTRTHTEHSTQNQENPLEGRVALVTGASRGIGAATARLLAASGAAVGVNYHRNAEAARRVVESIQEAGGEALAVRADARDEEQVGVMVRDVQGAFGPIDTLVLNAVTAATAFDPAPLMEQGNAEVMGLAEDQLRLALTPLRAVVPSMLEREEGRIVAVGSELSRVPLEGMGAVSVAKAAVAALMRSLALELGPHGIRVNVAAPGLVLTELNRWMPQEQKEAAAVDVPLRRNATPEDVAGAVLLLASGHAGFVTGAYLPVSGGTYMS